MKRLQLALFAGAFALMSSVAMAQTGPTTGPSADTVGSKVSKGGNTVGGTAGSAAAGGTSASTIGLGASSTGKAGTSSTVGGAGSAAAVNGRATSNTKVRENPQILRAQSRAAAMDGGTWSRSMSNTGVRQRDGDVRSWTRSMAHEPGSKPAMSSTRVR
jgi:hypothetical protein